MIIGENILLFGIRIFVLIMYRIRYFEWLMIFISDIKENELSNMFFGNLNEMVERLKVIVKINSEEKNYVDIYMLVFLL